MKEAQWKALSDYCKEFGYTKKEVVKQLKANRAIDGNAKAEDLGSYVNGESYDEMLAFLSDNL